MGVDFTLPDNPSSYASAGLSGALFIAFRWETGRFAVSGDFNWAGATAERTLPNAVVKLDVAGAGILGGFKVVNGLYLEGGARYRGLDVRARVTDHPEVKWEPSRWDPAFGITFRPLLGGHWRVVGPAAVEQTIAVVFTAATAFDLVGSGSAPVTAQVIRAAGDSRANVDYWDVQFTITQGSIPFGPGDRFYFEVVPTAPSYTRALPRLLAFERLGVATGAGQALAAANQPVHWGRQTVWERTALVGPSGVTGAVTAALQRFVVVDQSTLPGVAVGDTIVIGAGTPTEEYGRVGHIQTTDPRA